MNRYLNYRNSEGPNGTGGGKGERPDRIYHSHSSRLKTIITYTYMYIGLAMHRKNDIGRFLNVC